MVCFAFPLIEMMTTKLLCFLFFDSVAIEDVYKFRDDWDKCIVGSVDNFLFEIFAVIARFN